MKKVLLIILDGWGLRKDKSGNAIKLANTPNFDYMWKSYLHTRLSASGEAVGLPPKTLGGSEVGHLHIGAGRIVKQMLTRINESIKNGEFFKKKILANSIKKCKKEKSSLHLMGLLSDAGVHSHVSHLFALLMAAKKYGLEKNQVKIHCFLDGRDTPPKSAKKYMDKLKREVKKIGVGEIVTISGRYYAMDRDGRWNRTRKALNAILGNGLNAKTPEKALKDAYKRGETDEFVKPTIIGDYESLHKNDFVFLFNFRSDRMKQLTFLLLKINKNVLSMTNYSKELKNKFLFKEEIVKNSLGEVISRKGLKQLRIAESEKGPHVTYFFSGEREKKFRGEDRIIIPSPKVSTYDLRPEMSAYRITKELLKVYKKYDFILLNFANGDMVGHTGKLKAAIKGVEAIDKCLGKIYESLKGEYTIVVTADHGNCEDMRGNLKTSHTFNKVPFILIDDDHRNKKLREGGLSNIAPTILKIMKIKKPREMSKNLFK
ncbi:MAG: 2,3-bisphosphoglycerate-independent phosphoglycerate mutase [Candidatus Aenigmarchaeota archaeon]|nr:2,3-bisphosphoglycerate-independent phosphoglycerate mutase [Candidatus Aenigmarchaeota archaeon]